MLTLDCVEYVLDKIYDNKDKLRFIMTNSYYYYTFYIQIIHATKFRITKPIDSMTYIRQLQCPMMNIDTLSNLLAKTKSLQILSIETNGKLPIIPKTVTDLTINDSKIEILNLLKLNNIKYLTMYNNSANLRIYCKSTHINYVMFMLSINLNTYIYLYQL